MTALAPVAITSGHAHGRRLRALLAELASTTTGRSPVTLERRFGSNVHGLLRDLFLANHVEQDLGGRWRLTASGRNLARRGAR